MMFSSFFSYVSGNLLRRREHLFGNLTKSGLEVFTENEAAIALYKKLGYQIVQQVPLHGIVSAKNFLGQWVPKAHHMPPCCLIVAQHNKLKVERDIRF